jgi:hypothetical protein
MFRVPFAFDEVAVNWDRTFRVPASDDTTAEQIMANWEHYSHGADIGIRGYGRSAEEAFEQAAVALTAVVADVRKVREVEMVEVRCEALTLNSYS